MPIDNGLLAAFAITALVICLVPGPDMLFIVAMALRHGPRGGVIAAGGMAGGMTIHTVAAVVGLSALIASSATAFSALRLLGVAYLCWLAIEALRSPQPDEPVHGASVGSAPTQSWILFRRAAMTNLLNPKIILLYLAFLPQFTDPGRGALGFQLLILGGVFLAIGLVVDIGVGLVAGGVGRRFARSKRIRTLLDRLAAVVYLGLAGRLITDR